MVVGGRTRKRITCSLGAHGAHLSYEWMKWACEHGNEILGSEWENEKQKLVSHDSHGIVHTCNCLVVCASSANRTAHFNFNSIFIHNAMLSSRWMLSKLSVLFYFQLLSRKCYTQCRIHCCKPMPSIAHLKMMITFHIFPANCYYFTSIFNWIRVEKGDQING